MGENASLPRNRQIKKTHRDFHKIGHLHRRCLDNISFVLIGSLLLGLAFKKDWLFTITGLTFYVLIFGTFIFWIMFSIWIKQKRNQGLLDCPECGRSLIDVSFMNMDKSTVSLFFRRASLKSECRHCKLIIQRPNDH